MAAISGDEFNSLFESDGEESGEANRFISELTAKIQELHRPRHDADDVPKLYPGGHFGIGGYRYGDPYPAECRSASCHTVTSEIDNTGALHWKIVCRYNYEIVKASYPDCYLLNVYKSKGMKWCFEVLSGDCSCSKYAVALCRDPFVHECTCELSDFDGRYTIGYQLLSSLYQEGFTSGKVEQE